MQRAGKLTERDMISGALKTAMGTYLLPNGVKKLSFPTCRSALTGLNCVTMTAFMGSDTIPSRR